MSKYRIGEFIAYNLGTTVVLTTGGNELCRVTPDDSEASQNESAAAINSVLQAIASKSELTNALTRVTEKVERAVELLSSGGKLAREDLAELRQMAKEGRDAVSAAGSSYAGEYTLVMRNNVGQDQTTIRVHLGEDVSEVAKRVAESYGAKVVSVELKT